MTAGRCWTFPSPSIRNINEASSQDVTASLHRNVLSCGVWRGKGEKESVSPRAITHSASFQTADTGSHSGVSDLFGAASVPDGMGRSPKSAFSSITITVQRNSPSLSNPRDPVSPSAPTRPVKTSALAKLREPLSGRPSTATGVSNSQPGECREIPSIVTPDEFRRARAPADGFAARHGGKRTEALDRSVGKLTDLPSRPSYRSCVHLEVPPRSTRSVLFLDKSLYISLVELEGRRAGEPALYRSTLSVRFGVSSRRRSSKDSKPAPINEGRGRRKEAASGRNERHVREAGRGRCRSPLSKRGAYKVGQIAPTHDVNSDLDTRGHGATLGLSSLRGLSPSNTKAGGREGNADEAAFSLRSNFSHGQHTFNTGRVDFRTWTKQAGSDETEARQERGCSSEPQKVSEKTSWLKADFLEGTSHNLSLKEALELLRPDFISHSQGRVRRLEQRARRRRCMQDSHPDLAEGLGEDRGKDKRNCTTPDPHSDNLFKPRERTISGKEMQLRSRRIYNQLPEVTQKKEEEKKRAVSQTNRLRADVFKKRLLDQILQR